MLPSVKISSAPYAFKVDLLSILIVSGITITTLYPFNLPINESAIPVFPDVGSIITLPSFNKPSLSAASIIPKAALSLTLPLKLNFSSFTYTSAIFSSLKLTFTTGVFPIKSSKLLYIICFSSTFLKN